MQSVVLLFDHPRNLDLTLHFGDTIAVVDIIKSLQLDACNVSHPLIARAISTYSLAIRYAPQSVPKRLQSFNNELTTDQKKRREELLEVEKQLITKKQAEQNLDRIFSALIHDDRPSVMTWFTLLAEAAAFVYPPSYFDSLCMILEEAATIRRSSARISRIGQKLQAVFPEVDHKTILRFLREMYEGNASFLLPKPRNRKTAGSALRNSFIAWLAKSDPRSVKTYRSHHRKFFLEHSSTISRAQLDHMVEDATFARFKMTILPADLRSPHILDLSNLIVKTVNK